MMVMMVIMLKKHIDQLVSNALMFVFSIQITIDKWRNLIMVSNVIIWQIAKKNRYTSDTGRSLDTLKLKCAIAK